MQFIADFKNIENQKKLMSCK